MKEFKCLVDEATAEEIFALPKREIQRHIKIRTVESDGTLTMHFLDKEPQKPRTKTEYVKCEFSYEWEAVKHYNEVGELYVLVMGDYVNVNDISDEWYIVVCRNYKNLYVATEKEIDWREDARGFLIENSKQDGADWAIGAFWLTDLNMIKFCRLVESLTRHIEV